MTNELHWWTRTSIRERRIILDESDLWDGNTYAERTWEEFPPHIQKTLEATQRNRVMLGFANS